MTNPMGFTTRSAGWLLLALAAVRPAVAQMLVTSANSAFVEDFNAGVVMQSGATEAEAYGRKIVIDGFDSGAWIYFGESELNVLANPWHLNPWNTGARFALDSRYVAASYYYIWGSPQEMSNPSGVTHPFSRDYNNNANSQDASHFGGAMTAIHNATLPDLASATNYAMYFPEATYTDNEVTFRFVNRAGKTIDRWTIGLDAWAKDAGGGTTTFRVLAGASYAVWSTAGLTEVASAASGNANAGWVAKGNLSGTVDVTVADGASLFVQMRLTRNGGGGVPGNGFAFDNLSVTACEASAPKGTVVIVR